VQLRDDTQVHAKILGRNLNSDEYLLLLAIDRRRELKALSSLKLEMYISCGMFLGLLCHVFALQGYLYSLHWLVDDQVSENLQAVETKLQCQGLALITLRRSSSVDYAALADLRNAVCDRRTHRGPFGRGGIDGKSLQRLLEASWPADLCQTNLQVQVKHDPITIKRAADLVARYASLDFSHHRCWRETYNYLRFSPAKQMEDGFYLQNLMGPMSQWKIAMLRITFSPAMMQVLRLVRFPQKLAAKLAELVVGDSQVLFCSIAEEQPAPKTLIRTGARLMEIWLNAQTLDIAIHPLSVMLQHDRARRELSKLADVQGRLIFFARLGYINEIYLQSPRRSVEAIIDSF
jgi:hypothetical protein